MTNIFDTNPGTLDLYTKPIQQPAEDIVELPNVHPLNLIVEEPFYSTQTDFNVLTDDSESILSTKPSKVKRRKKKKTGPNIIARFFNWFKRRIMWFKRKRKKYNVWKHKLGKIEMDPAIRQEFRTQRRTVSNIIKKIDSVLDTIEQQAVKVEQIEEFTKTADGTLTLLQEKTAKMR